MTGVASPEQFGALADDIADDSGAIMAAVAHLEAAGGGTLDLAGTYYTGTTSIIIPPTVTVRAVTDRAQIRYAGIGTALQINGTAGARTRRHAIPVLVKVGDTTLGGPLWDLGQDTTSIGLAVVACQSDHFLTSLIRNFNCGLKLSAVGAPDGGNCFNNTVQLGFLRNNKTSLLMESYTGEFPRAGVNQNTFLGGKLGIDGAWNHAPGRDAIFMTDDECNTNTFLGTNIEKGALERGLYCNSPANLFLNIRVENATAGYIKFGTSAYQNKLVAGAMPVGSISAGAWASIIDDAGRDNTYWVGATIGSKGWTLDAANGRLLFGNLNAPPAYPIAGYGTNRIQFGSASLPGCGARFFGSWRQEAFTQTSGATLSAGYDYYNLNYSAPGSVVNIANVDATLSGRVQVFDRNGNVTLIHTASPTSGQGRFVLKAGVNKAMVAREVVAFHLFEGNLYEV